MTTAQDIIDILELERHPEGGWYIQTFRDEDHHDGRAHSTAIYYLLEGGDRSHWHTVDAVEIWHYHAGAPLELGLSDDKHLKEITGLIDPRQFELITAQDSGLVVIQGGPHGLNTSHAAKFNEAVLEFLAR